MYLLFYIICEVLFLLSSPVVFLQSWKNYIQKEYLFHCAIGLEKRKLPIYMIRSDILSVSILWLIGCIGAMAGSKHFFSMLTLNMSYMILMLLVSELSFFNRIVRFCIWSFWMLQIGALMRVAGWHVYRYKNRGIQLHDLVLELSKTNFIDGWPLRYLLYGICGMLFMSVICLWRIHCVSEFMETRSGTDAGFLYRWRRGLKSSRMLEEGMNHKMDLIGLILVYLCSVLYCLTRFEDIESAMLLGLLLLAIGASVISMLYHWDRKILVCLKLWGMPAGQFYKSKIVHSLVLLGFPGVCISGKIFMSKEFAGGFLVLLFLIQSVWIWNAVYFSVIIFISEKYGILDLILTLLCTAFSFIPLVPLLLTLFIVKKGFNKWYRYVEGV